MHMELCAGLIIVRNISDSTEYLLLQKSIGEQHWTPPKGHLDIGENDLEAAIRETKEEAGLRENEFNLIDNFKIELNYVSRKGVSKTVWYWIAEIKNPNATIVLSSSHKHYRWLKLQDAIDFVKYDSVKNGLKLANEFLKNRKVKELK
jgi:bis(5'-nucleosidyl)-tetraphosphatase